MRENTGKIRLFLFCVVALLLSHSVSYAQKNQEEYLKTNPEKKEFNQ